MGPRTFLKLNYIPIALGIVFTFGLALCFVIAVARQDVSPYVPFISETGGKYPEAGLFSIFLYLSATVGMATLLMRYLIVDELNKGIDKVTDWLNKGSIIVGFIAMMGMVTVAAYPMTTVPAAHNAAAMVLFVGSVIYATLQTWLTFKMTPYYNGKAICYIRLVITVISVILCVIVLSLGPIAFGEWKPAGKSHWTGSKTPADKGFGLLVGSAAAEWMMAIMFVAYYFTFIREFSKVAAHVRVQVLVEHFDDEVRDINSVTERTPIVI